MRQLGNRRGRYEVVSVSETTSAEGIDPQSAAAGSHPVYPRPVKAWSVAALLFLVYAISIVDRNIVTLLVGPIQKHFALSDVEMSLLIGAAFSVSFGLFSIPLGWMVDRFQRRHVIATGVTAWSIATIATGVAQSFTALLIARCSVGIGDATMAPANSSVLGDLFPRDRLAFPMAVVNLGLKAGQGASLIIGAFMMSRIAAEEIYYVPVIGQMLGWQLIFILVGLPGMLIVPAILAIREPARQLSAAKETADDSSFASYFRFVGANARFFVPHHLGLMGLIAISYAIIAWTPSYLMRVHGWPAEVAGSWLGTAFLIGPILGMPLHGAMADLVLRRGCKDIYLRYPMISAAVGAPLGLLAFSVSTPELATILVGCFLFILSSYVSLPITAVIALTPNRLRGKATAVVGLACSMTGGALGPLLVGLMTDVVFVDQEMIGYSLMISIAILTPMVVVMLWLALKPLRLLISRLD